MVVVQCINNYTWDLSSNCHLLLQEHPVTQTVVHKINKLHWEHKLEANTIPKC